LKSRRADCNARERSLGVLREFSAPPRRRRRRRIFGGGRERACSFGGPAATGGRTQIDGAATRARCGGGCETAPSATPPPTRSGSYGYNDLSGRAYPPASEYYVHGNIARG